MDKKEVLRRLGELEVLRLAVKNIPLELRFCEPDRKERLKKDLESARLRVQQLESAMQVLTPEERLVIHRMCIAREKKAVRFLCQVLQVEQSSIYRRRDRALRKLGNAMGGNGELTMDNGQLGDGFLDSPFGFARNDRIRLSS